GIAPGALPCQLLDHGTGYLAAAAALDGLRRQSLEGGTHVCRLSLARTAAWLTLRPPASLSTPTPADDDPGPWLQVIESSDTQVTAVKPPGAMGDHQLEWPVALSLYGDAAPAWRAPK